MLEAVVSLGVIALCVWVLSIITDEFFIVALDQISDLLNLPPSVAGASLMAMGSSAPELAIAILALFGDGGAHSDIGIGTIVGSAVFNILIIVGVSAAVKPAKITLSAIIRDCVVYALAVGLLLVVFRDGAIEVWECAMFLGLYGVYLVILLFWKDKSPPLTPEEDEAIEEALEESVELVSPGPMKKLTHFVTQALRLIMGDPSKRFFWAFLVSIVAIGGLCYVLVEAALVFAGALNIPPVIVALTVLAGGTSVPDLISSVVVAKQGRGDMAVANAVGSNIFDILICLGLPWLISILVMGKQVHVGSDGLTTSVLILLGTVGLLFFFAFTSRTVTRIEGYILIAAYIGYAAFVWLAPQAAKEAPAAPAIEHAVPLTAEPPAPLPAPNPATAPSERTTPPPAAGVDGGADGAAVTPNPIAVDAGMAPASAG